MTSGDDDDEGAHSDPTKARAFNLGAFVIGFGFSWVVFDNIVIALMIALVFFGGSTVVQSRKQ
ncbi:MAG: hypothetical protein AAGH41_02590 [Pseudomonadota bacterium]